MAVDALPADLADDIPARFDVRVFAEYPSGTRIFVAGSPRHIARFERWLEVMQRTETGRRVLDEIGESGHDLLLKHDPNAVGSAGGAARPMGTETADVVLRMHMDQPDSGTHRIPVTGGAMGPFFAVDNFVHEMGHALRFMTGEYELFDLEEDAIAIANQFRSELRGPNAALRTEYDGEQVWFPETPTPYAIARSHVPMHVPGFMCAFESLEEAARAGDHARVAAELNQLLAEWPEARNSDRFTQLSLYQMFVWRPANVARTPVRDFWREIGVEIDPRLPPLREAVAGPWFTTPPERAHNERVARFFESTVAELTDVVGSGGVEPEGLGERLRSLGLGAPRLAGSTWVFPVDRESARGDRIASILAYDGGPFLALDSARLADRLRDLNRVWTELVGEHRVRVATGPGGFELHVTPPSPIDASVRAPRLNQRVTQLSDATERVRFLLEEVMQPATAVGVHPQTYWGERGWVLNPRARIALSRGQAPSTPLFIPVLSRHRFTPDSSLLLAASVGLTEVFGSRWRDRVDPSQLSVALFSRPGPGELATVSGTTIYYGMPVDSTRIDAATIANEISHLVSEAELDLDAPGYVASAELISDAVSLQVAPRRTAFELVVQALVQNGHLEGEPLPASYREGVRVVNGVLSQERQAEIAASLLAGDPDLREPEIEAVREAYLAAARARLPQTVSGESALR